MRSWRGVSLTLQTVISFIVSTMNVVPQTSPSKIWKMLTMMPVLSEDRLTVMLTSSSVTEMNGADRSLSKVHVEYAQKMSLRRATMSQKAISWLRRHQPLSLRRAMEGLISLSTSGVEKSGNRLRSVSCMSSATMLQNIVRSAGSAVDSGNAGISKSSSGLGTSRSSGKTVEESVMLTERKGGKYNKLINMYISIFVKFAIYTEIYTWR